MQRESDCPGSGGAPKIDHSDHDGRTNLVNSEIVGALQEFYVRMRDRHNGRFPEADRVVWSGMNAVLGGIKTVNRREVSAACGVSMEHLRAGSKRWDRWMDVEFDAEGHGQAYLQDVTKMVHGNSWPMEWVAFIIEMWQD